MSWLDDIVDVGKSAWNFFTGDSMGAKLAKTALTGYTLNQVTKSMNKGNEGTSTTNPTATPEKPDPGSRIQLPPSSNHKIPVLYGKSVIPGIITDVNLSSNHQTMSVALTICERTGKLMSTGEQSVITLEDVYCNDSRIVFKSDGITANYMVDKSGNVDRSIAGLIQVYFYSFNKTTSQIQVIPNGYTNPTLVEARTVMPNWNVSKTMNDLVFAIVKVTYNKQKNLTTIPNFKFTLRNTLTMPGDCLYDYMTNTRYGAGLTDQEIKIA